jgi:hypothetical protein
MLAADTGVPSENPTPAALWTGLVGSHRVPPGFIGQTWEGRPRRKCRFSLGQLTVFFSFWEDIVGRYFGHRNVIP